MGEFGLLPQEWEAPQQLSDVGQYGGVRNASFGADQQLFVRFDLMPEAKWHEVNGEKVVKEIVKKEYVWIQRPGEKTQIYHQRAKRRHIRRFPRHYEAFKSNKEQGMLGVPLTSWNYQLSMSDIATLKILGIEYVHQLATINDSTLPALGLQGKIWRSAAQVTMQEMADTQKKTDMQLALNERDEHIRSLQEEAQGTKEQLAALLDEMAQLKKLAGMKDLRVADPVEAAVQAETKKGKK